MEKAGSGNSAGERAELDALLSAADEGMLETIRDNLDLDTGFAQILGGLAGVTPPGRPVGPAATEPGGHAHSYGYAPDPILACEVSGAARRVPAPADPKARKETRSHHKTLITLALSVITALNVALLSSPSHNHGAVGEHAGVGATSPKPIAGETARAVWCFPPPRLQWLGASIVHSHNDEPMFTPDGVNAVEPYLAPGGLCWTGPARAQAFDAPGYSVVGLVG